ncbi:hypothetical protein, partial [Bradyrhizobium lablabi]|uniref:hypothetical protein n=1 Tax=Bradyrhizobium lablabi TaxID=722472 RepID=UPI000A86DC95
ALIEAGRAAEALPDAREGVRLEEAADHRDTIWKSHWHEARATRAAAGNAAALLVFDQVIAALDGLRRASLGFRLDSLFLKERLPAVEEAIFCAAAHGDAERCLAYADAVKSRFLSSALAAGPPPTARTDWLKELDQLGAQIEAAEAKDRRELVLKRAAVVERIRLERGQLPAPASDPAPLLELLAARGQAALQLFHAGGRVVAVLLHDGQLSLDMLELSPETLTGLREFAHNLMLANPGTHNYDPKQLGLDAIGLVPPQLLERALGANALLVAPHGALNILPWAALPRGGQRLFQCLPVGQLPCISALLPLAARPAASPRLALLGDPQTPHATQREAKADLGQGIADLATLYGPDRMAAPPVTGQAASTAGFHALLAAPGAEGAILHLALPGRPGGLWPAARRPHADRG